MRPDIENKEQNKEQIKEQTKVQGKEVQTKEVQSKEVQSREIQSKEQKKEPKKEIKEKKINNKEYPSIIKNFIGKEITITLRNGNKIKGRLETVVQYELVITTAYDPIIVMKHAIDYIELVGEK